MSIVDDMTADDLVNDEIEAKKDRLCQICACAIVALMTQQILGSPAALLMLMFFGCIVLLKWRNILARLPQSWPILLFPIFAVASTIWSEDAGVTLRYSIQLTLTFAAGIAIAAAITPSRLIGALYLGSLVVAVLSILSGRQGASAEGMVLIGLTGAKNQIASLAQMLLVACPLLFFDRSHSRALRASALITAPVALYLLIQANSATGILTAIGAMSLLIGLVMLRPISPAGRVAAIVGLIVLVAPFVVLKDTIVEQAQTVSSSVFKKDPTLTGRTYLWRQADRLIAEKPVVGHGYRATWLGKSANSIGLLRWAGVPDPRGFNFHNTYKELQVDTGAVGTILFILGFGFAGMMVLVKYLRTGDMSCAFLLVMAATLFVKTFAELIIGPFQITVLLLGLIAAVASPLESPPRENIHD